MMMPSSSPFTPPRSRGWPTGRWPVAIRPSRIRLRVGVKIDVDRAGVQVVGAGGRHRRARHHLREKAKEQCEDRDQTDPGKTALGRRRTPVRAAGGRIQVTHLDTPVKLSRRPPGQSVQVLLLIVGKVHLLKTKRRQIGYGSMLPNIVHHFGQWAKLRAVRCILRSHAKAQRTLRLPFSLCAHGGLACKRHATRIPVCWIALASGSLAVKRAMIPTCDAHRDSHAPTHCGSQSCGSSFRVFRR